MLLALFDTCLGDSKCMLTLKTIFLLLAGAFQASTILIWTRSSMWYVADFDTLLVKTVSTRILPDFLLLLYPKTYSDFEEDYQVCEMGIGGYACIAASSVYLLCAVVLCSEPFFGKMQQPSNEDDSDSVKDDRDNTDGGGEGDDEEQQQLEAEDDSILSLDGLAPLPVLSFG